MDLIIVALIAISSIYAFNAVPNPIRDEVYKNSITVRYVTDYKHAREAYMKGKSVKSSESHKIYSTYFVSLAEASFDEMQGNWGILDDSTKR